MNEASSQIRLIENVYQLPRDIISPGYDEALEFILSQYPDISVQSFPSGSQVLDWVVPSGWSCRKGIVEDLSGNVVLDKAINPIAVASYSQPVDTTISKDDLLRHIVINKQLADEPPFLFYYYQKAWKFGCGYALPQTLDQDKYRVLVDSEFYEGELKVAEWFLPGESDDEFIFSTHLCHPYQVNDGLSGVATGLELMNWLSGLEKRKWSYRLIMAPETIGSVCWLHQNLKRLGNVIGGMFLEMTGLNQRPALQRAFNSNNILSTVMEESFRNFDDSSWVADYRGVIGNDERQFNGPGFRIPMLSYSRALPWGHPHRPFKEYHSYLDNLDLTSAKSLQDSFDHVKFMIQALESERSPKACFKGEAFLSGLGLALDRNQHLDVMRNRMKIMDRLDGTHSVSEISKDLQLPIAPVDQFISALEEAGAAR